MSSERHEIEHARFPRNRVECHFLDVLLLPTTTQDGCCNQHRAGLYFTVSFDFAAHIHELDKGAIGLRVEIMIRTSLPQSSPCVTGLVATAMRG